MFCRFCGKSIQEDSDFCPYCGKPQRAMQNIAPVKRPMIDGIDISIVATISSAVFYVGIVVFLILFIKMAPGIGTSKIVAYIIGATITIVGAAVVNKIRNKKYTKKRQLVALVFGLLLLIPSITLRIVYECKVDAAVADIPKSGTVCVEIEIDEEFYSYYYEGMVREPYSRIILDGQRDSTMYVELSKPYNAKIVAGYAGRSGVADSSASGSTEKTITFTQEKLSKGYTITEQVPIDGGYADVTVNFKRICTFWEVIFYSPS